MKRFTSFMLTLLFAVTAWAQTPATDGSKVYTLAPSNTSSTGVICVPGTSADKLYMSTHSAATQDTDPTNINQRFAFLTAGDKTYMYSLGAQKFVADNGTGTALLDAGKMNELTELLKKYGADTLVTINPTYYGAVAADLRALGAQI